MSDLEQRFEEATKKIDKLSFRPTNDQLLEIYALYKQSTNGDCDGSKKPGLFDPKNSAKYEAWLRLKGMSQNDAKEEYIKKANFLTGAYGKLT